MKVKPKDPKGVKLIHCRFIDRSIGMAEAELLHAYGDLTMGRSTAAEALSNAQESLNHALGDWDSPELEKHIQEVARLEGEVRRHQKQGQPTEKVAKAVYELKNKVSALEVPGCPHTVVVRKKKK